MPTLALRRVALVSSSLTGNSVVKTHTDGCAPGLSATPRVLLDMAVGPTLGVSSQPSQHSVTTEARFRTADFRAQLHQPKPVKVALS